MISNTRFPLARTLALTSLMGVGSVALPAFAFACDDQAKITHYVVAVPATVREANDLMRSSMSRIETAYAAQAHADIHEASYGLEAAAARIAESGEQDAEVLGHSIEILHLGSEIEDQAILDALALPPAQVRAALEALADAVDLASRRQPRSTDSSSS